MDYASFGMTGNADYTAAPAPVGGGGRQLRAFIIFDNVENAGLMKTITVSKRAGD
jgi:hypothetical protein